MSKVMGTGVNRTTGRAKVTGTATYAAEHQIPGLVHGYLVTAGIAHGRIKKMDIEAAQRSPGVIAVYTSNNAPPVFQPANNFFTSKIYESRLPLSDNKIHYGGQIIGLVVAETFEQAREAAHRVTVEYETQAPIVDLNQPPLQPAQSLFGEELSFKKGLFKAGDVQGAIATAAATIKATYTTSTELHAPMEPHAIIAEWQGNDDLTIYEPSQFVMGTQRTYADLFGIPSERIRIITPYIGGGFGSKAFPWPHGILCAAAARQLQRPLKVVLSRRQMTANAGHRGETEQTLQLAAANDGSLIAIDHQVKSATSPVENFPEPCISITPVMYATPNMQLNQKVAVVNVGTPTFMRAPGENPGLFALESAMDELAWALKQDPVKLRLKNETLQHQKKSLPFASKYFADCLWEGVKQFGWEDRPMETRALLRDDLLVGWGMAASTFPAMRGSVSVKVRLLPNQTVHVLTSGNDMGTGAYTMVAITAAEALGVPVDSVRVEMGDSKFPNGGIAGGSQMTASLAPAVMAACQEVLTTAKVKTAQAAFEALQNNHRAAFEATASSAPGEQSKQWAFQSWGAHFCEVTVDEAIGRLRVTRWVSVMNIGRVINAKAAASQIRGAVIMGIGQALMEECTFDPNLGYPMAYDLATYHFPAHADVPRIDVAFVGGPDLKFNPAGVRGVGEIGITGVAPAIANALYHATGKRLRSLPMTPDKLIQT